MSARLWAYNYNFEFELANQKNIRFGNTQQIPWWFLNRSASLYIPLAQEHDSILTYQLPQDIILQQLRRHFNDLPRFVVIEPSVKETNCVLNDFKQSATAKQILQDHEFSPWGWSSQAMQLAEGFFKHSIPANFKEIIFKANSKQTSDDIRTNLLPQSFQIPSLQINNQEISINSLKNII